MKDYQTGAVRDTGGKGRMDLLPWSALLRVSRHMEDAIKPDPKTGIPHYPERNWEKGLPLHTMIDSAFRHLAKYMDGWDDEDHLCAAATNLLMALWTEEKMPEMQDIATRIAGGREEAKEDAGDELMAATTPDVVGKAEKTPPEASHEAFCVCQHYEDMAGSPRCNNTRTYKNTLCGGNPAHCQYPKGKLEED